MLLLAYSQTFAPPKFWVGYTTGRTSNVHADIKKLIIINTIQLSLLYFFCVTRLGTEKRCQFSFFLVDASLDDFSVLFHHLYEILIVLLRPRCSKHTVIYHINGVNFDKSIVIDILVGLASLEHLQPQRNDHCLRE